MHQHIAYDVRQCLDLCVACAKACHEALGRVLTTGQELPPERLRLLLDCADACETAARFMARGSERHPLACGFAHEVARACADACLEAGGEDLERCAEACERCASACAAMARGDDVLRESPDASIETPAFI